MLATESPLLKPEGDCTLHLLFTLSDLFIIALCTKPPMPFVGDAGRSSLSGEIRPCDGDILTSEFKLGGSSRCAFVSRTEELLPPDAEGVDWYASLTLLPNDALLFDGEDILSTGSSTVFSGCEFSRAIPGI